MTKNKITPEIKISKPIPHKHKPVGRKVQQHDTTLFNNKHEFPNFPSQHHNSIR